tara:strand:- start:193 stop:321 length:129 start_codon:yes stop_codon:yes gene_type:complete
LIFDDNDQEVMEDTGNRAQKLQFGGRALEYFPNTKGRENFIS